MIRIPQGRMDSKAGDTLSYSATRTGTCQTNSLSGDRSHQAYARVQENPVSNGNAISRGNQTLIYDEENSLVEVQFNSVTIAEYTYDSLSGDRSHQAYARVQENPAGDGNRVESVVTDGSQTITTVYIGSYYEQITTVDGGSSTTEWDKYYYAGAVRLAMRENSEEPYYLISDHLGSTSLVVDSLGQEVARQSYLPFGEEWGSSVADLPTTFTYTGQREAAEIGLHYYIARWYDAGIGHFLQADIIVPGVGNPRAWNRYGYVLYNPLKYTDPSGHWVSKKQFVEIMLETTNQHVNMHDVKYKRISQYFNPYFGVYIFEGADPNIFDKVHQMIYETLDAYNRKNINVHYIVRKYYTNPLTTQDVWQDLYGDTMPLEIHLSNSINHRPYFIFISLLSEAYGIDYLSGNNWEMNFEPLFLAELMIRNPEIVEESKIFYLNHEKQMLVEAEAVEKILDILDDPKKFWLMNSYD